MSSLQMSDQDTAANWTGCRLRLRPTNTSDAAAATARAKPPHINQRLPHLLGEEEEDEPLLLPLSDMVRC